MLKINDWYGSAYWKFDLYWLRWRACLHFQSSLQSRKLENKKPSQITNLEAQQNVTLCRHNFLRLLIRLIRPVLFELSKLFNSVDKKLAEQIIITLNLKNGNTSSIEEKNRLNFLSPFFSLVVEWKRVKFMIVLKNCLSFCLNSAKNWNNGRSRHVRKNW